MTELDDFLARHIPLTRALGVRVARCDAAGLVLAAPLAPNVNDKGTGFAGALASIVTLTGWALTRDTLLGHGEPDALVVIAHSGIDYLRPVRTDFEAVCARPAPAAVDAFVAAYRARGKARWTLEVHIDAGGLPAVRFKGQYAAWRPLEP